MADNYGAIHLYYFHLIGHKPRIRVIPYFRQIKRMLRCPACGGPAHIGRGNLLCDNCHRGWQFDDLLYPPVIAGPASSSGPASGSQPPEDSSTQAQPGNGLHANLPGCASLF